MSARNTDAQRLKIVEWFEAFPDTPTNGKVLERASGIPAATALQWLSTCLWYRDNGKPHKWAKFADGLSRVSPGLYMWQDPEGDKQDGSTEDQIFKDNVIQYTPPKREFVLELEDDKGTWVLRQKDTGNLYLVNVQQWTQPGQPWRIQQSPTKQKETQSQ